jgi:hypothetical protein
MEGFSGAPSQSSHSVIAARYQRPGTELFFTFGINVLGRKGMREQKGLSPRQRILRTFQRKRIDRIAWQPRIYYWYYGNRLENKLPEGYEDRELLDSFYENIQSYNGDVPEEYKDKTMLEIYDNLKALPRYPQEVLGVSLFRMEIDSRRVKCITKVEKGERVTIYETPLGTLREVTRHGYHTEYPVKTPQDMRVMRYILDSNEFRFDAHAFDVAERTFRERAPVQSFYPRSPLQRLIIAYMGFENTIYALNDHPREIHDLLRAIEEWDDVMYEVILNSPLEILNFGENIDANIDSPKLFEEYFLPYYKKRCDQIHRSGKFCHIHMDGSLNPLLPLINEAGFDGIEAATPSPQGDVTLEELKDALGDTILIDGIPAILFLPEQPQEQLEAFTTRILEMFSPNLILGVSDELPPTADIERVTLVSKIVGDFKPYPDSSGG